MVNLCLIWLIFSHSRIRGLRCPLVSTRYNYNLATTQVASPETANKPVWQTLASERQGKKSLARMKLPASGAEYRSEEVIQLHFRD